MKETINSINVAILLSANALCWVIRIPMVLAMIMIFCVVLHWVTNRQFAYKNTLGLYLYCMLFFLFPLLLSINSIGNNIAQEYFLNYFVIGYAALLISQSKFNIKKSLIALSVISIIMIPTIVGMDLENADDTGVWMSVSYGVIRFIAALVLCLLLYKYKFNLITKIVLLLPVAFYSVLYATYASRGAILAIVVFFVFFLIVKGGKGSFAVAAFTALVGIVVFANFIPIVIALVGGLQSIGVDIYALDKILIKSDAGDVTNGREQLISVGFKMFMESPIWGHGVGAYEVRYGGGAYIHNIILQQLIEGGLLLFVPLALITLMSFRQIFNNSLPHETRLFLVLLMSTGLIELFFSNYFWRSQGYWFLIGYTLSIYNKQRLRNRLGLSMTSERIKKTTL